MGRAEALHNLLGDLFGTDAAGLRRFVAFGEQGEAVARSLPGVQVSMAELAHVVADELMRRDLAAGALARLRAEFPRRQVDIDRVARVWSIDVIESPSREHTTSPPAGAKPPSLRRVAPRDVSPTIADVAVLIALKEEWAVFWMIAGKPEHVKDPETGRLSFSFDVPSLSGRPYHCVATFMSDMGPGQATDATHLLLRTKPLTLVNLGIAAAIHDDLKLCDVIVADQVDDYFATVKATTKGEKKWDFELRGSVYKTTFSLVQDVDGLEYAHPDAFSEWHTACAAAMSERTDDLEKARSGGQIREAPAIQRVHLASGPVLAATSAFSLWVRKRDGVLKALEMEAAGMMLAAHQRSGVTSTLVLRGISDFGDRRKSKIDRTSGDSFRYLAMFNATQLLWALMWRGLLPQHEPESPSSGRTGRPSRPTSDSTVPPGDPGPAGEGDCRRSTGRELSSGSGESSTRDCVIASVAREVPLSAKIESLGVRTFYMRGRVAPLVVFAAAIPIFCTLLLRVFGPARQPVLLTEDESDPLPITVVSRRTGAKWNVMISAHRQASSAAKELFLRFIAKDNAEQLRPYMDDHFFVLCQGEDCFSTEGIGNVIDPAEPVVVAFNNQGKVYLNGLHSGPVELLEGAEPTCLPLLPLLPTNTEDVCEEIAVPMSSEANSGVGSDVFIITIPW